MLVRLTPALLARAVATHATALGLVLVVFGTTAAAALG